ncbi:MAG: DNA-3-methyladenine glycosylase family protein [Acidimicrobiia bacterium]
MIDPPAPSGTPLPMIAAPRTRSLALDRPLDLRLTLGPTRYGKGDPSCLLRSDECFRATRTPLGPATTHLVVRGGAVEAEAWGPGADWALDQLPLLVGEHDDVDGFQPTHEVVAELVRRHPGLRIGASHRVLEALVPAVCAHQVTGFEGRRAHRQVMQAFGEPAPGPAGVDLTVPPDPRVLASTGYQELHPLGLERARADVIRRAAARAVSVEAVVDQPPDEAERRLRAIAGVGAWTAAFVRQVALGDADAVPVGDERSKHLVAWAFLGEPRGSDAQMLELLDPYRGHRGRVLRLLHAERPHPHRATA